MGTNLIQRPDGSVALVTDNGSKEVARFGGDGGSTATVWRSAKTVCVPFAGGTDTGGGILSWPNPEAGAIVITNLVLDVTTKATGACTASFGTTASSATTSSANLIDSLDVGTAAGTFDSNTDKGTNGKTRQKLAAGGWVTGSRASGASAGLVGVAYITYTVV